MAAQIVQRRIAGAEIVEHYGDPRPAQGSVVQQHALGDLELQAPWRQSGLGENRRELLGETGVAQLQRRHVDGHPRQFGADSEAASLLQHPFAKLADHATFFGDGDELCWRQATMDLMSPADQRLGTEDRAAVRRKIG